MNIQDVPEGKYFGGLGNFDAGMPTGVIKTNVFKMIQQAPKSLERFFGGEE